MSGFSFDWDYLNNVNDKVIIQAGKTTEQLEKHFYYDGDCQYTWDICLIGDRESFEDWDDKYYIGGKDVYDNPNELVASTFEPAMDLYYQAIDEYPDELDGVFVNLLYDYDGKGNWDSCGCFVLYPTGDGRFIMDNKWYGGYK